MSSLSQPHKPHLTQRVLSATQKQDSRQQLGERGEIRAQKYLESKQYQVLDRNVQLNKLEIDLIALDQATDEIVFIEVKTRSQAYSGNPSQAVSRQKLQRMQKVAWRYLQERNLANDFRFDIISIWPGHLEHFENVTWLG